MYAGAQAAVEIDGAVLFGAGYEGGWHAAKIIVCNQTKEGDCYDVELQERSPLNQMPQVARSVPVDYIRPNQVGAMQFQMGDLKPGMVVEHMLPETPTCWWLAFIVEAGPHSNATIVGYPGKKGQTETVNQDHKFRRARHWDFDAKAWVSPLQSSYAAGFQPSMEANFGEIAKRRRSKGLSAAIPAIYDPDMQPPPQPPGPQAAPARAAAAPAAVAGEEAAHKRRRASSAGGGARTKGALTNKPKNAVAARPGNKQRQGPSEDRNTLNNGSHEHNQTQQVPASVAPTVTDSQQDGSMQAAPVPGAKRKSHSMAHVPTYRPLTIGAKKDGDRADENQTGAPENQAPHAIKAEAHTQQRGASMYAAGEREGGRAAPSSLVAMHSNSDTDCIDVEGVSNKERVMGQLDIREREQAVRQKEIQTVQLEIGVILPLISSDAIPAPEKAQLRKCLYAKLAKAGLTELSIVPSTSD